jgi:hypothetical protein
MDKPDIRATLDTRHRTKSKEAQKHKTTEKTKRMSNTDPTKINDSDS